PFPLAREAVGQAVVREIGQRVAERRELPVEHRGDARLARVNDDVAEPEVAVHERGLVPGRDVLGHPRDQALHRVDLLRLGGAVLLGPPVDLAREVVPGPPEVGEAEGSPVHRVKPREDMAQRVVHRRARARGQAGDRRVGDDAPVHAVHDVEHGADDRGVRAERVRPRHGKAGRAEGRDDPVLPVHRVRGGEELAGRLPPEHVLLAAGREVVSWVRLAAPELLHGQRAAEARDVHAQVALERGRVEPVLLADLCGGRDHPDRPAARQYNPTLGGRHMTSTGPAGPWTHAFARVDGVRLHYVRQGAGTPVLLLHGWPGIGRRWREPGHARETWYQIFHTLPWAHELVGGSREATRLYLRHFLTHWSGRKDWVTEPELDHWVDAYSQPGALRGGFAYYKAFQRGRRTQAD